VEDSSSAQFHENEYMALRRNLIGPLVLLGFCKDRSRSHERLRLPQLRDYQCLGGF
jgi:hypothetical protein